MMRLTLDALTVLDAIDRKGSFAAAADELHRVPSAISYTIQKLEQDLDVLIFDRRGHRAILTAAGRELLEQGRHLLRAAESLEARIQRVATGWEASLIIGFDALLPIEAFYPVVSEFYHQHAGTRLRLTREVLGGTWDALVSRRADLVIGTVGEGPAGGGYSIQTLGNIAMRFVVGLDHPLASADEPLSPAIIQQHRAVAIADSSRIMAPRSAGLLSGQDVFTVPDLESKIRAHVHGLGVGYLPRRIAEAEQRAGRLHIKTVTGVLPEIELTSAWRSDHEGKALRWFLERLSDQSLVERLLNI